MKVEFSEKRALNLIERHLARLADHLCPPPEGGPSPFEERLAKIAAEAKAAK